MEEEVCTIIISTVPLDEPQYLYLIAIAAIIPILILIIAGILAYYYYSCYLHQLPREISWSFLDNITHPWRWSYCESGNLYYYTRGICFIHFLS
jgi:hypothetical protein